MMSAVPVPLALALGASLVLAADAPDAGMGRSPRVAVVGLGACGEPAGAISARAFRALLAPRLGASLQTEVETAAPLGGLATRTLADVQHALSDARAAFYRNKLSSAASTLEALVRDVTRLPPSDARWAVEREVWTLLAQVRSKTSRPAAEEALRHVFRVEPDFHPDVSLYPPSFRAIADKVRKLQAHAPSSRLDVAISPASTDVYVDGRRLGRAPVTLRLPAGTYRIEADFGRRSLPRSVQVPDPPQLAPPVELGAEVEGALFPDGGPCAEPGRDHAAALARLGTLLVVDRLLAISSEGAADRRSLVLHEVDGTGTEITEGRAHLSPGAPETEALASLAELAASGRAPPGVEVSKGSAGRGGANEARVLGRLLGIPAPAGFTLEAYGVEGHAIRAAVHLSGDHFELTDVPARRTVLHVSTDDGRVALAVVEAATRGDSRKDLTLEAPCVAAGRVLDQHGRPVAGARLFAALRPSGAWRATRTGPRGGYAFGGLVRGDYDLLAVSARVRLPLARFSLQGDCRTELPVVVLPAEAVPGQGTGDAEPGGR